MKKIFALIMALAVVTCACGCSSDDNTSSEPEEIEYESIIVDENGNEITDASSSKAEDSTTQPDNTSSVDTPSTSTPSTDTSSEVSAIKIDYNTVVEVDICDDIIRGYLSASDAKNQFYWLKTYEGQTYDYQNLSLEWYRDGSSSYTLYFSENADFSNAITTVTTSSSIKNTILIPGKTYHWKVIGTITSNVLGGGKIKVNDAPVRWIQVDKVGNVRDMGGWKTESGKTVKYGMLYRGRKLENISEEGIATIKQLGLKTELDLRRADQKFQTPGTGLNYEFIEMPAQYDGVLKNEPEVIKASYRRIFWLLSDKNNYPFYAHCMAGADRTGTFAFIVNGLLGVSYEDLTRDFELTSFSESGKRWRGKGTGGTFAEGDDVMQEDRSNTVAWGRLYKTMMEYGTKNGCSTLQSSIEHWLLNYVGVPQSQIDSFKSIMLQ